MTAGELIRALRAFDADDPVAISVYLNELMVWCEPHDVYLMTNGAEEPLLTGDLDYVQQLLAGD